MGEVHICVLMMVPDIKAVGLNCKATLPPKAARVIPALHANGGWRDILWPLRCAVRLTCSASKRSPIVIGHHIGDREVLHSSPPHAPFFPPCPVRPSLSNPPPATIAPPGIASLRNILPSPPSLLLFLIKVEPRQRRSLPLIYFHLKLVQLH